MIVRRRVLLGLSCAATLVACAAPVLIPPADRLVGLRRLRVVTLGPVPLEVPPAMASSLVAQLPKPSVSAARGVLALSSILMLAELPEALKRSALAGQAVSEQLQATGLWSPGMTLGQEVARQLSAIGREVSGPTEKAVPGAPIESYGNDPSAYVKAVNEWWGASNSLIDYGAAQTNDVDALIEVSLQYAAFFSGALTLILRIKVIDPSSRAVIARNRDFEYRDVAAPAVALANDGEHFKRVFNDVAGPLVRSTLAGLGFKPA
jgi:hypothetical protein